MNYYSFYSGSAIYGLDFISSSLEFALLPTQRSQCLDITIIDDNIYEKNETFGIHVGLSTIFLTILDNDGKSQPLRYKAGSFDSDL